MSFELTREYIEELQDAIGKQDKDSVSVLTESLHAADLAEIFKELTIGEVKFLYLHLKGELRADVLIELEEDVRERFLRYLTGEEIAEQIIRNMDTDDAADVIGELSETKKEEVLRNIRDPELAGDIVDLLNYDEDTAGGLMAKELIKVNENWSIMTCLKEMRKQAGDVDEVYHVYVVDNDNKLKGTLSLKKLLLADTRSRISDIYKSDVHSVKAEEQREEVANIMNKYDLVALPVVDSIGRLLGRITIDDVVDVIREEAERDYQLISGISEDVEPTANVFLLTRARLPWLFIGLLGGIFSALVLGSYEDQLRIYPEMAFFIPMIGAMGGNVGVQSSAIVVQGLASHTIRLETMAKKLFKELKVASINGVTLSSIILAYNLLTRQSLALTLSVSSALLSVILFASMFGTFIPLLLDRMKLDAALATGPFITTTNDICGLFIYLLIGHALHGVM